MNLKIVSIKNRTSYYFNAINETDGFDIDSISIDEKAHKRYFYL